MALTQTSEKTEICLDPKFKTVSYLVKKKKQCKNINGAVSLQIPENPSGHLQMKPEACLGLYRVGNKGSVP